MLSLLQAVSETRSIIVTLSGPQVLRQRKATDSPRRAIAWPICPAPMTTKFSMAVPLFPSCTCCGSLANGMLARSWTAPSSPRRSALSGLRTTVRGRPAPDRRGHEFETLATGGLGREAGDQNLCELAAGDDPGHSNFQHDDDRPGGTRGDARPACCSRTSRGRMMCMADR